MRDYALPLVFFLLLVLTGCAQKSGKQPDTSLLRAAPSYMHWMQKQSMLNAAPGIIAEVSQTGRVWLQGAEPRRTDILLKAAPNWLLANTAASPVFAHANSILAQAEKTGFGGIYLGMTGERPDIWLARQVSGRVQNPASLDFDRHFGTDADFERLAEAAEQLGIQVGSSLLPGATGMGPDFLLQARHAGNQAGLYAMLAMPEENVSLPKAKDEWDCKILNDQDTKTLVAAGVLPDGLGRDKLSWASRGGWAITGSVNGADGKMRRWVYRYAENPMQPVLAWQDPSGNAGKVLAAAVIRQTGIQGQTLTGLHLEPLMALEPGDDSPNPALSPGLDALNELARQIHRYGGWAMQADSLPVFAMEAVLEGPCDLCRDDVTQLLVLFGLLEADGRPLAALYRSWIEKKFDVSRLARGFFEQDSLDARILLASSQGAGQAQALASITSPLNQVVSLPNGFNGEQLQRFLLSWRLGLPGLAFVAEKKVNACGDWLKALLLARRQSDLANGKILGVTRGHGGGFGLLSQLPNGGFWLLACNFGVNADELNIGLPDSGVKAMEVESGRELNNDLDGHNFRLSLDGRAVRNVIFLKK